MDLFFTGSQGVTSGYCANKARNWSSMYVRAGRPTKGGGLKKRVPWYCFTVKYTKPKVVNSPPAPNQHNCPDGARPMASHCYFKGVASDVPAAIDPQVLHNAVDIGFWKQIPANQVNFSFAPNIDRASGRNIAHFCSPAPSTNFPMDQRRLRIWNITSGCWPVRCLPIWPNRPCSKAKSLGREASIPSAAYFMLS